MCVVAERCGAGGGGGEDLIVLAQTASTGTSELREVVVEGRIGRTLVM